MNTWVEKREAIQRFYSKHSIYIDKIVSFIICFCVLAFVNKYTVGSGNSSFYIVGLLAVVCAFVPIKLATVIVNGYMLVRLYFAAPGMAITALCFVLLMYIFYFRFAPKNGHIFLLMPIAFVLKVPMLIPIVCGLLYTPVSAVAVALGVMFYYLLNCVKSYMAVIDNVSQDGLLAQVSTFTQLFFGNKEMWFVILTFVVCVVLVYSIRRSSSDNAWKISIIIGSLVSMVALLFISLDTTLQSMNMLNQMWIIIGTLLTVGIAFLVEVFAFPVDYSRTETLNFEDDEYFYYVKAVPKLTVAAPEKVVKTIHERQETKSIHIPDDMLDELDLERLLEEELNKES